AAAASAPPLPPLPVTTGAPFPPVPPEPRSPPRPPPPPLAPTALESPPRPPLPPLPARAGTTSSRSAPKAMITNPRRCLIAALLYRIDVDLSNYPIRLPKDQKADTAPTGRNGTRSVHPGQGTLTI